MTRIVFRDASGSPVAGAVIAVTTAPGEMTDLGYVTGDDGAITLTLPEAGSYGFTLTSADGGMMMASKQLGVDGDFEVTAHPMG